jgi:hypothetical protein
MIKLGMLSEINLSCFLNNTVNGKIISIHALNRLDKYAASNYSDYFKMGLKQISEDSRSEDLQEPQLLRFK